MKQMLFLLLPLFLFFPFSVSAIEPVEITEIMILPIPGDQQWVELHNPTAETQDLSIRELRNSKGGTYPLSGELHPNEYKVISWEDPFLEVLESVSLYQSGQQIFTLELISALPMNHSWVVEGEQIIPSLYPTAGRPNPEQELIECSEIIETEPTTETTGEEPEPDLALESATILLNEIYANPQTDEALNEFIELYNPNINEVNLDQWILADASKDFLITDMVIPSLGYALFPRPTTSLALNNTNETVQLIDPFGILIAEFSYETTTEGQSWNYGSPYYEAIPSLGYENNQETLVQEEIESNSEQPLPEEEMNVTNEEVVENKLDPNLHFIRLSEFLSNPVGSDSEEWIELVNTGDETVNLKGLTLADAAKEYHLDEIELGPKEYLVLQRSETGLSLNNTDETVSLKIGEEVIDDFSYLTSTEGFSWALIDAVWQETSLLTPGEENQMQGEEILEEETEPVITAVKSTATKQHNVRTISYGDWTHLQEKEKIILEGIVTVAPKTFQTRTMYIQGKEDPPFGLEIYFHKADWPALKPGDLVRLTGEKSVTQKGSRLLIRDKQAIEVTGFMNLSPTDYQDAGHLIFSKLEGIIIDQNASELLLDVDGDELIINLKKADLKLEKFDHETKVEVIGIKDENLSSLVLRSIADIQIMKEELEQDQQSLATFASVEPNNSSDNHLEWAIGGVGFGILAAIGALKGKEITEYVKTRFLTKPSIPC